MVSGKSMLNKKRVILISVIAVSTTFFFVTGSIGFCLVIKALNNGNPFIAQKLVKYCSDDGNYHHYTATFKKYDNDLESHDFFISYAYSLEDDWHYSIPLDKEGWYRVTLFSSDFEKTIQKFSPYDGLSFDFVMLSAHYNQSKTVHAVVEITTRYEEILSFDEGKTALIEWAKKVH